MVLRGVIANYAVEGYGTVVVNGDPYPFTLERMWQSPVLPKAGMQVYVTFSPEVGIASIVVAEAQPLVAAPASFAPPAAASAPFAASLSSFVSASGTVLARQLAAVLALAVGWFALPFVTVNMLFFGEAKITFWQILGHFDALSSLEALQEETVLGMGLQVLAITSLLAALAPLVSSRRPVRLAALAPLLVMVLAAAVVGLEIQHLRHAAEGFLGSDLSSGMAAQAQKLMHVGSGGWLALLAALWLAGDAIWKFASTRE